MDVYLCVSLYIYITKFLTTKLKYAYNFILIWVNIYRGKVKMRKEMIRSVFTDEEEDSIAPRMKRKRRRNRQPEDDDDENNSYEY